MRRHVLDIDAVRTLYSIQWQRSHVITFGHLVVRNYYTVSWPALYEHQNQIIVIKHMDEVCKSLQGLGYLAESKKLFGFMTPLHSYPGRKAGTLHSYQSPPRQVDDYIKSAF
jgi:hypothetical protein